MVLELCLNVILFSGNSWLSLLLQARLPIFFLKQLRSLFVIHPIVLSNLFLLHLVLFLLLVDEVLQQVLRVDDGLPSVQVLDVLKRLHELHFPFGVVGSVLEILHGVFLLFVDLQPLQVLLRLLRVLDGLVIPGSSRFHDIVMVLRIRLERDLGIAIGTFEVKPKNFDAQIGLLVTDLHTHVELSTDVQIIRTSIASQGHGQHVSDHHQLVLAAATFLDAFVVEVFGEIFDKDLTLSHLSLKYYTLLKQNFQRLQTNKSSSPLPQILTFPCGQIRPIQWTSHRQQQNQKYNFLMTSKAGITITQDELIKMKMRANLIPNPDSEENKATYLYQQSQKRTDQWSDNLKDLKKRKEEERYKKFEKEELERRRVDEEQRKFQQKLKEEELAKANAKLFQDTEQVRGLNSKLLFSDTLQGREEQLEIKNYIKNIQKKREQIYHEETINQIKKGEQLEQKRKEEEKKKLKKFEKDIRKQHKQVKKQYINKYKEEMEEGELLKMKAEEAIREEEEKERERRERNLINRKEINQLNEKNKELRALELQKEREEEARIEEYRKKQEIIQDITKKRHQDLINEKIKQREELYAQQTFKMSQIKSNEVEKLSSQIQELEKKQAEIERKKAEEKRILKHQYEQSLKDQVQRRKREKEQELEDNHKFKQTWKDKLTTLKEKESNQEKFRKNVNLKNADQLKRQMQEKQQKREQQFRRELAEAEEAKANIQNQEKQFKSYAEKCLKEWQSNGKNLYPIIKQLSATMKST